MSQPIQRQADQWSLPDRQASSTYEPSQAELRDLLGGPRIQSGLLNTREASTRREAVPRETPAGNLNMSPRKLDQQVTKEVQNKALKPPKPKPIPDDLGQDQSFKVPNQLQAHRDPPVPGRGYLASFFRHAEGGWNLDPSKVPPGPSADAMSGSPVTNAPAPKRSVPMPPAGGISEIVPDGMSMSTYLNNGMAAPATGGNSAGYPPAAPAKAAPAAPATNVSDTTSKGNSGGAAPSAPASSSKGTGGGGDTGGSGWTARDIAPGSIDTGKDYTVQRGDTLAEIAQGAGIKDYNDIAKANNIADPDKINEGQVLHFSPSPGGPSTPVDQTPAAAATSDSSSPGSPLPAESPAANVGGPASAIPGDAPLAAEAPAPGPVQKGGKRYSDPPLPPRGQLKKFLGGSRHLADTTDSEDPGWLDPSKKKTPSPNSPENTNPALNNPPAPQTPSQKAGEPIKPPPLTPAPSQPTSPNTPASPDATQGAPVKTNDLANASNPNSPTPSQPAGNPAQPASPSGTDQPKTPGSYGPDIGNGFSLSDAMGVIGGIGQGIGTALSIGGTLAGALSGGGIGSLISGFGGLGMLGSSLGITAAAQQQIEASARAVKEHYV